MVVEGGELKTFVEFAMIGNNLTKEEFFLYTPWGTVWCYVANESNLKVRNFQCDHKKRFFQEGRRFTNRISKRKFNFKKLMFKIH